MKRLVALVLWGMVVVAPAAAQSANDVLYLQDGRERVGELVAVTPEQIVFLVDGEDEPTTFAKDDIQRIDLSRKRAGDEARTAADLDDPLLERLIAEQPSDSAYPDSGYVVLYRRQEYTLGDDGSYVLRERQVEKVLLERGKDRATVALFKKGEETLEIDFARTIDPDGTLTPISDAAVDISSTNAGTPEYEKLHQVKFAMKQVKAGSLLDYQFTTRRPATDLLYPFFTSVYFRGGEPILEAELCIHVPRGSELVHRLDRVGDNVKMTREETEDLVTYRFVATNCPRVVPESMMPPAQDLYPRVTASLEATWADIGAAYSAAMQRANQPSEDIKAQVAELVAGTDDPTERARRVYHYFIKAIHQQSVGPWEYSYAPHPAAEVFARRAGNSIDKALLLCVMLKEAGLSAGVVLACPQSDGKLLEDVPNIRQFGTALVAVTLPSGRQFLSLADESVRFGQMPAAYQGTRGLLVTADGSELVDVPLNTPEDEMVAVEYRLRVMPNGDVTVLKTETATGNAEVARRNSWKDEKDEELRRSFEVALTAMHPKARLDDYTIENLHDVTKPLKFTQRYTLVDYAMRAGAELLVLQLPEVDYGAASVGKPAREFPLRWYRRSKSTKTMTIELPPGYRVYYAGKDYAADCGVASFSATFAATAGEISYQDVFVQNELEGAPEDYADYKGCIETRVRVSKEWIVLERVTE